MRDYDLVLGTTRGDTIKKAVGILKSGGLIVSLVGPLDKAFAKARRMNAFFTFLFGLMSHSIRRRAKNTT